MEGLMMDHHSPAAESLTTSATLFTSPGVASNTTPSSNVCASQKKKSLALQSKIEQTDQSFPQQNTLGFHFLLDGKVQTLSTHNAPEKGPIQGLLYVPSLDLHDPCNNSTAPFVPSNVTRKDDVSPFGRHFIGLAPWFSVDCTQSFLEASRDEGLDALVFYLPSSDSEEKPPSSDDSTWILSDNDMWKSENEYPVYAIPGPAGTTLMEQLAWYSENATSEHSNHNGSVAPADPRHNENVRLFTFIDLSKDDKKTPSLWGFVLAILGGILVLSILILLFYQIVQKRRRQRLQRRIEAGEADLEFLGLNQMKVPQEILDQLPKYTYPEVNTPPDALLNHNHAHSHTTKLSADGHGSITTIREEPEDGDDVASVDNDSKSHLQRPEPATTTTTTTGTNMVIPTSVSEYRLSHSQTTCAICLDDYEPGLSIVREMPCGHIFDVDCIDTFLTQNSSLCPLCKKSVLPSGSYPIPVTNVMVQRDYIQRRSR